MVTHCFSIDIEGFCEGMAECLPVPEWRIRSRAEREEIAANVDEILAWLDVHGVKATFFVLGVIAEEQPEVVRRIADGGHEVACHSHEHLRLYNFPAARVRQMVVRAKAALEDVSGREVTGFRAPDFSVSGSTLEILDILREAGFSYDSSIYPISGHDVYGVKGAEREIHTLENGLVEFPPATVRILGRTLPALGGGYFRLYPLAVSRFVLRSLERRGRPAMVYIHPYELGSRRPTLDGLSATRRFRHYVNIDETPAKFERLFEEFAFGTAREILQSRGFL